MQASSFAQGRVEELLPDLLERKPRALGRAITLAENGGPEHRQLIQKIYRRTGKARVVGLTGPPGSGKSTLVDRMARLLRQRQAKVGILAVDPTSPFTGGSLLGDRIRMQALFTDPEVFIRSMATRGALGGLARATRDAVDILDAAGFDWVLVETVGVGQDEVDVVRTVDTVVVVTLPGLGDDIQAIKAGITEIADIFVINKADLEGVERTHRDLTQMLEMAEELAWRPPIVRAIASRDEGIAELLDEVDRHGEWLESSGHLLARRRSQLRLRVETILKQTVLTAANELCDVDQQVQRALEEQTDPYQVAERLYASVVQAQGSAEPPEERS
jgi:LAO/AO transport system kinase